MNRVVAAGLVSLLALTSNPAWGAGETRTFAAGSLIIPMDLAYQDRGLFQSYGLVFQLLRQGVPVAWVIDPAKTWHANACDAAGDECSWDCEEQGSGVKCPYPTGSPDFFVAAKVVWDGEGALAAGTAIANHGYRGGPFVIAAADRERALPIIEAWNDQTKWTANPWARRAVFHAVSVHEATAEFTGFVRKQMVAAPTIAVFADGNEDIATSYLRAAGIPQSNGSEFPTAKCAAGTCGAGSPNPDMLTVPSVAGDMGTCEAPNFDHRNGQLFKDGVPAYCQIMSMHWNVTDRETVQCNGGGCPATQAACTGQKITYHGHEVVAEVRSFLQFPVHFFAECQAVNAYENTVPNAAWPFLDDTGREGHFLTTKGSPPDCPNGTCTDGDFACVAGGCDGGARDCCLAKDLKEQGAGFLIATQPASATLKVLHPEVPYNQLDGALATVGGSEPAYNLSTYLGTAYKNAREVTFLTGPNGPGAQDVWMTGYADGVCDIVLNGPGDPSPCTKGKVSYLGGHSYGTGVPLSSNPNAQGTRLFLNALFEADCVTSEGQPIMKVGLTGDRWVPTATPQGGYTVKFDNLGNGSALDATLALELPAGVSVVDPAGGTLSGATLSFPIGAVGAGFASSPAPGASRAVRLAFAGEGAYTLSARLSYRVGVSVLQAEPATLEVAVAATPPPGLVDGGTGGGGGGGGTGMGAEESCGCSSAGALSASGGLLALLAVGWRRRRP